jgi:nitroreductase
MTETIQTILSRFSCRDFSVEPLSDEHISVLIDTALASPSARNRQPWHIIMITDKALIDEMDVESMNILRADEDQSTYKLFMERGGKMFYDAPCMMMVASDGSDWSKMDCGIVSQNVSLAAHSLGLGSVICGMARIPLAGSRGDEFKKRMQFPKGYDFGIAILFGKVKSDREPHELDRGKVTYIK